MSRLSLLARSSAMVVGLSPAAAAAQPMGTSAPPSSAPAAQVPQGAHGDVAPADGASTASDDEESRADAAQDAQWARRDRRLGEANTINGGTGLLRTQHAETGAPGQLRLQLMGDWFSGGFLCSAQFPCPNPKGGAPLTSDTTTHVGATLSASASLFSIGAGTFDGYASIMASSNSDAANRPALLQALGDMSLGAKYVAPVADWLHLGLFSELWLINGTGSIGLDGGATSAKFGGIGTVDLRAVQARLPVRFSVNAVYSLDNTGDVVADTEAARKQPVTRIERYGMGINRVDHVDLLVGGELFAVNERVRPFVEERIEVPNNRQGYQCYPHNPSADHCLANDTLVTSSLTLGGRFFPWKRGFHVLAALDIGTGGTSDFIEEVAPTPPWTLYLGAGWAIDTQDRPPVVRTRTVERPPPAQGHVVGFVHDKDKVNPVVGAIATYRAHPELSPLATAADGKFADDVPPGPYIYDIRADGYRPGSCDVNVPPQGGPVQMDCPLDPLPPLGTVDGHVLDATTKQPVVGVQVQLTDAQGKELRLPTDGTGAYRFDGVAAGVAELRVQADGFLVLVTPTAVEPRREDAVDLLLRPKPRSPQVQVTKSEIAIGQQIQFALDSAVILPESFSLLTEIADTLIRHPDIAHVEVQGHTDDSGPPDHNQLLSKERAEAVVAWLVEHGVSQSRLVARGYGQDHPLTPNVTAADRARNRRVEFVIVDRQGAGAPLPSPPPSAPKPPPPLPGF